MRDSIGEQSKSKKKFKKPIHLPILLNIGKSQERFLKHPSKSFALCWTTAPFSK